MQSNDPKGKKSKSQRRAIASAVFDDGTLVEMLYRPEKKETLLCVCRKGEIEETQEISECNETLVAYSPTNNLLAHEVVLFPSEVTPYESIEALIGEVRDFIHAYVDVSPLFEEVAAYYVLFTWIYDGFNELPYLRVLGDTGSGKTRCLLTVGSLCYKPIFASGASTVSPLFRILDSFNGTLIVDEGDFRFSDEKAEIIKILNNGNARGFPVLRSEAVNNGKEFSPRAFSVFGPKFIATRKPFEDRALESRCLTEETSTRRLRDSIPLNLSSAWKLEALHLRNKLLDFRFRNFGKRAIDTSLIDRSIEPRLAQSFGPLLSVIDSPETRTRLLALARKYHEDLVLDRSADTEAQVLECIRDVLSETASGTASVQQITRVFVERHGGDYDRKITPKWIGSIIRRCLQLRTYKSNGVFILSPGESDKLKQLNAKYGVA